MMRRTVALIGGLIVLILAILLIRGCLNARKEQAIKDYSNDSVELLRASKLEGDQLFKVLQGRGGSDQVVTIQNSLNGLQVESSELVDRANNLDVRDEVSDAQRHLLDVLELRRDGLRTVATATRTALGDQNRREGARDVTRAMQVFLASDTLQQIRFEPALADAARDEDIAVPKFPGPFVPDVQWLDGSFVADQINGLRSGTGGAKAATPGLHGNGIASVSLGGTTLQPGASATVQLTSDLSFEVGVQNQGENTENDVNVKVTVGQGSDAIKLEEPIDTIAAGEMQTVTMPLAKQPPTGQNVPVKVEVEPVPGEEKTDNNTQEYSVIFTS